MTTNTETGLVGFLCEVTDEPVTFQECLACAQRGAPGCPMVPAIIHDIASSVRSPEYANDLAIKAGADIGFSATELLNCPRQYRLKKQHPYWEKPSGKYRMTFGSGYHAALSTYQGEPDNDGVQHYLLRLNTCQPCHLKLRICQGDTRATDKHQTHHCNTTLLLGHHQSFAEWQPECVSTPLHSLKCNEFCDL